MSIGTVIIIVHLVCAIAVSAIFEQKGRDAVIGYVCGAILGVIGLVMAVAMPAEGV